MCGMDKRRERERGDRGGGGSREGGPGTWVQGGGSREAGPGRGVQGGGSRERGPGRGSREAGPGRGVQGGGSREGVWLADSRIQAGLRDLMSSTASVEQRGSHSWSLAGLC